VLNESYIIGFKEGLKIGLVWLVFSSYLSLENKRNLLKSFYAGLVFVGLICFALFFLAPDLADKDFLGKIISTSFALFLILSAASLIHASGTKLFGKGKWHGNMTVLHALVFLVTSIFFTPDIAGALFFINELSFMRDGDAQTYINAFTGFIIAIAITVLIFKLYGPSRLGKLFAIPQLLLFLAMVKLLGSGIRGFTELSLIPSVQRGFIKFTHDFIHQVLVLHMIPDHPLLKTTTWNFIGIFFGANLASLASLIILLFCPLMFLYYTLFKPVPNPEKGSGAQKRKLKSITLFDRRKKALPVLFFLTLIMFTWFLQRGETISRLFVPKPSPVVVEKGMVVIPVKSPATDLMDGSLHSFSLVHEEEGIRILIVRKTDNSISVSLDACEICPPDGYGQREEHVVCIYCGTPIHIDSLGQPGGCNPIPLEAEIDGTNVKIRLEEILDKWGFVKSGDSKEAVKINKK
jgi:hypothetical protein